MLFRVSDTETTGFPPNASMVEFGYTDVVYKPNELPRIIGPQATYLKPKHPIQIAAMAVHHITEEMVANAKPPEVVLSRIHEGVDYFVFHNSPFDTQFYRPPSTIPVICTLKNARIFFPEAPSHSNQFLRYFLKLPCDPAKAMPPHGAAPDSYVTAWLLVTMLGEQYPTPELLSRMINATGQPSLLTEVRFGKHRGKKWSEVPHDYLRWILSQDGGEEDVKHTARHYLEGKNKT